MGGAREVEDVALGDAEVLEKLPGGVGEVGWNGAAEIGGKVFDGFVEGGVGLAAFKESEELLAQGGLLVCLRLAILLGSLLRSLAAFLLSASSWMRGRPESYTGLRAMTTVSGGKVVMRLPRFFSTMRPALRNSSAYSPVRL